MYFSVDTILASESPRRKELLKLIELHFRVIPSHLRENNNIRMHAYQVVTMQALRKAESIASKHPDSLVIGADTIVYLNGRILGKPLTIDEAKKMLTTLSGKTHSVYTGVAFVRNKSNSSLTFYEKTSVTFYRLKKSDITYYVENNNPLDKAGAYGIQDWSACFIKRIDGCYYNVIGLPIPKFYQTIISKDFQKFFDIRIDT